MRVEGGEDHSHAHGEGPGHVQPVEGGGGELPVGEVPDDLLVGGRVELGEPGSVAPHGGHLVQPGQGQLPRVPIVGHVGVLVPVELTGGELAVHQLGHRDPRLGILGHRQVAEGDERRLFVGGEEGELPRHVHAIGDDLGRGLVPRVGSVEDVEIGVPADHLGGDAPPLARQPGRMGRLPTLPEVGQVVRPGEVPHR